MIGIINYKVGNLRNLENALRHIGEQPLILNNPREMESAKRIILPGVGAFGHAAENLKCFGFHQPLLARIERGTPVLGICVGMQLLFEKSHELGEHAGLGCLKGEVKRFEISAKIPQIGWNTVQLKDDPIAQNIADNSWFYFVHSYVCRPRERDTIIGTTKYEQKFCSVARHKNVWGAQFHPEKSQNAGLRFLRNFCSV